MANVMEQLMTNPLIIIAKTLALFKFCCLLVAQIFILAFTTWLLLVKTVIKVQVDVCWNAMTWAFSLPSLPSRMFTALQREKMLERKLHEMQTQVENLTCENKELEERLDMSFRECREIESVFAEMEEELGNAFAKINLLENELKDLKDEKLQLSEVQGKGLWDYQDQDDKVDPGIPVGTNYCVPSWSSSSYSESKLTLHDVLVHGDTRYNKSKSKPTKQDLLGAEPVTAVPYHPPSQVALEGFIEEAALRRQRRIVLSRSVFSAVLSLVVGTIIWEAEDPCMPLVGALFIVVGMSLSSVVQFFSTIKNKPASEAVALLSFNWFILGTLTSPTLPRVTRILAPPILRFGSRVLSRFGFTF